MDAASKIYNSILRPKPLIQKEFWLNGANHTDDLMWKLVLSQQCSVVLQDSEMVTCMFQLLKEDDVEGE
jgi:hypothetical protein